MGRSRLHASAWPKRWGVGSAGLAARSGAGGKKPCDWSWDSCYRIFFSIFVAQENGSSSQQMDDLFDILIQSGGKAQTPKRPSSLPPP